MSALKTSSPFWDLCQWDLANDDLLKSIHEYLGSPATKCLINAHEEKSTYPLEIRNELHRLGLPRILFPCPSRPTPENTFGHIFGFGNICAQQSLSVAIDTGVNLLGLMPLYVGANDKQKKEAARTVAEGDYYSILLSEKENGSDILSNSFHHVEKYSLKKAGNYLTGKKDWINGGSTHEHHIILSSVQSNSARASVRGMTLFWCRSDNENVTVTKQWQNVAAPAADISSVEYNQYRCDDTNKIGPTGSGFRLIQDTFSITRGVIGVSAAGMATATRKLVQTHVETRKLYGTPISTLEELSITVKQIKAKELTVDCLTLKCMYVQNRYGTGAQYYSNVTKFLSSHLLEDIVEKGKRIHGAHALLQEYEFHRLIRDSTLPGIFDGSSHVCLEGIQWSLAQATGVEFESEVSFSEFLEIFEFPQQSLHDIFSSNNHLHKVRCVVFNPLEYAKSIVLPNDEKLLAVSLVGCLTERIAELKKNKLWMRHQHVRHRAAQCVCFIEGIFALSDLLWRQSQSNHNIDLYGSSARLAVYQLISQSASALLSLSMDPDTVNFDQVANILQRSQANITKCLLS